MKYDFSGWATKANVRCSDGRVIKIDAFKDCDGAVVPLVWNHQHNDPSNVLGHALLQNRGDGVYAYCSFNNGESGQTAKMLVENGDIKSLSILANDLVQKGTDVIHGIIREVSLVLAGANPKAFIEEVMAHGDDASYAVMYFAQPINAEHGVIDVKSQTLMHADEENSDDEETLADVYNSFTEKQKKVVHALIGEALNSVNGVEDEEDEEDDDEDSEGGTEVKHNVFDQNNEEKKDTVLSHDAMKTILGDAKRFGTLKESFLQHAETYGINQIDYLFPDARNLTNTPEFISRDMDWVQEVMNGVHKSPFSRVKSIFADITEDDARAKGYIKGKMKKDEVFSLLKRTTSPTTVYKKQKMDRDDMVDITDFDHVAWLKTEMRMMLNEELARAYLVGDGRLASSDDKIDELCIRPIWTDSDLFTVKKVVDTTGLTTADQKSKQFIRTAVKARKDYKGSGNPILFTTEDVLTDCLLIEDANGRVIYDSVDKLATALRVRRIVTVPVMENLTRDVAGTGTEASKTFTHTLMGIIVNLSDYNVGADRGGAINMFDDFDIDYNQQKYLIETRCSGALTKPYSAIVLETRVEKV